MASETASIDAQSLLECCPFSFVVDGSGRLAKLGKYFAKMHPEIVGLHCEQAFKIVGGGADARRLLASSSVQLATDVRPNERLELQVREGSGLHIIGTFLRSSANKTASFSSGRSRRSTSPR